MNHIDSVYRKTRELGGSTRISLSTELNINKNTISKVVDELISRHIIEETGLQQTDKIGRKPIQLHINRHAFQAVGVSITATEVAMVLTDFCGNPLNTYSQKITNCTFETITSTITELLHQHVPSAELPKLIGIGIGIPGIMEQDQATIKHSSHLKWVDAPLLQTLRAKMQHPIPLMLDNNNRMAAIGEVFHHPEMRNELLFYCNIGHGVGGSFVINGEPLSGAANAAGEFGHITIDANGPLCRCGNRGCLEALVSTDNLLNITLEKMRMTPSSKLNEVYVRTLGGIEIKDLVDYAKSDDEIAMQVIRQAGEYVGAGLSYVVNLLNPHKIILSGELFASGGIMLDAVKAELRKRSLPFSLQHLQLDISKLGPMATSIGAAASVISKWMPSEPRHESK